MQDLAKVVQRWEEVRNKKQQEDGTETTVNKILDTATRMLEGALKKDKCVYAIKIFYGRLDVGPRFEVELYEDRAIKRADIEFMEWNKVGAIFEKIIARFQVLPQVSVTKDLLTDETSVYGINYAIKVSLKES